MTYQVRAIEELLEEPIALTVDSYQVERFFERLGPAYIHAEAVQNQ